MFRSKKGDKIGKRRLWPWGKQSGPVEDTAEHVSDDEVATETEVSSDASEIVSNERIALTELSISEAAAGQVDEANPSNPLQSVEAPNDDSTVAKNGTGGMFSKITSSLGKTRTNLVQGITTLFVGKREIDDDLLEELETHLLMSDVGVEATKQIVSNLSQRLKYKELDDANMLISALKTELQALLKPVEAPLIIPDKITPFVILVVGVNGVGKTTTIGKLARHYQKEGKKILLAAGDTFRAAAVEQLQIWGRRNDISVISQPTGSDSASVLFDAFQAAKARKADILIADTAGRLHNKDYLMEELRKVKRVLSRLDSDAPHESLLVLDAGTGQNALNQARLFNEAIGLDGIALTKLDGTAKGGVIFALSHQLALPIRFLGVGEQVDDLRPFKCDEFVKALFSDMPSLEG